MQNNFDAKQCAMIAMQNEFNAKHCAMIVKQGALPNL